MTYPTSWAYPPGQLTGQAVKALTPTQCVRAEETGLLDQHLGRPPQPPATGQLNHTDLQHMTPEQIEHAREAGQLDQLMNGDTAS